MKDIDTSKLSWDEWDELHDPRPEENGFDKVVEEAISRRGFLGGVLAFGSGAAAMGTGLLSSTSAEAMTTSRFPFDPLPIYTDNPVHVPAGYKWSTLVRWGDPLFSDAPEFSNTATLPSEGADRVMGENTDGMELFEINGREIIAVNSEYVNT